MYFGFKVEPYKRTSKVLHSDMVPNPNQKNKHFNIFIHQTNHDFEFLLLRRKMIHSLARIHKSVLFMVFLFDNRAVESAVDADSLHSDWPTSYQRYI